MLAATLLALVTSALQQTSDAPQPTAPHGSYIGFDRNEYPGDASLKELRRTFTYSGYWLNIPPGAKTNSWTGKRKALQAAGFGFLVIFNGRTYAELKSSADAAALGSSDATAAVTAAHSEGFPLHTVIFLDQEEGGRLLPEQRTYLHAWIDGITSANFAAGVYCSGISFTEGSGATVVTAQDIHDHSGDRKIRYWVVNDSCPPSPGCTVPKQDLAPEASGIAFADVWQFAQSPKRKSLTKACSRSYDSDGNCYAPSNSATRIHVDLNVATSDDPSQGRTAH